MAEYVHDKETGIQRLSFKNLRSRGGYGYDSRYESRITSSWGSLTVIYSHHSPREVNVNRDKSDLDKLKVFKSCSIYDATGKLIYANPIDLEKSSFLTAFPANLSSDEGTITLSTQEMLEQQKNTSKILEKICHDTNYSDVTFVFPPTEGFKLDKPSAAIGDKEKFFAGPTLVAHKVILAQWPYFKLMFESDFAEGGSGHRQVTIKDTSLAVFKVLLRYIYTETVPVDDTVKYVYDNPLNFGNVSWELIFLASDRYDIAGLREEAQRRLITNLCEREVKNFLFRPAYLFHDLRVAAIEYIAKNCGHLFIPSSSRDLFKDHAEYATILGELYETLYNFHVKK